MFWMSTPNLEVVPSGLAVPCWAAPPKSSGKICAMSAVVTLKSCRLPSRITPSVTVVPTGVAVMGFTRSLPSRTGLPFRATITSPIWMPDFSAGPPGATDCTKTPSLTPATFRLARACSVSDGGNLMPMEPRVTLPFLMIWL